MDVELTLLVVAFHASTILLAVIESLSARRLAYAVAALLVVLAGGTVAFHQSLNETWMQSAYRTVVTISLAGLDTVPKNDSSRAVSIVLVLVGLTIFAYIATVLVEGIARRASSRARLPNGGGDARSST